MEFLIIILILILCFEHTSSIVNRKPKRIIEKEKHNPISPFYYEYLHLIWEIDIEDKKFIYAKKSNKLYSHYSHFPHENLLFEIYNEFCRFQTQHRGKYFDLIEYLTSPDLESRILAVEIMKANLKK